MPPESYPATCWNCLGEFDALSAVWCSDDPTNPTKLCPFCLRCFCEASERYKQEFWRKAPRRLQDELATLNQSQDRLGDLLIRMKKLTTPQLLTALVEQKATEKRLGEILTERGMVKPEDIAAALKDQGVEPLADNKGTAFAAGTVWEQSGPEAIIQYILTLAARKGASDVQIEPKEEAISVKYRIDGFFFRVDPIPKHFQAEVVRKLFQTFALDPKLENKPQQNRITAWLGEAEYDLVAQTLPTSQGLSATVKLINRGTFLKDITALGLEVEDRVRLLEALKASFGLILITAPVFNGAYTTAYSLMSHLARSQRDVVSLESPVFWPVDGVRQVGVEAEGGEMERTLRSVVAVRPQVVMLSALPDRATAQLAVQLASSMVVVAVVTAQSAGQGLRALVQLDVPPQSLAGCLAAATCQRLVRQICGTCRRPADPPAARTLASHGLAAEETLALEVFRGQGCPSCNKVGYRGRRAIFEVLRGTPEVRSAVLNDLSGPEIEQVAVAGGMTTLRERCLALVRQGATTFEEFTRLRL